VPVPDRVYAAVQTHQPSGGEAAVDFPAREAQRQELSARHHAALPRGKLCEPGLSVSRPSYSTHTVE
jgi:hypothetical protein